MNTLREAIHEYIDMRRNLGFKLNDTRRGLLAFARFMEQQRTPFITESLALAWAQQPVNAQPAHWAQRLSQVRVFARYRKTTDPRTEIPSPGLLPFQPKRAKPYLYSDKEIQALLQAALEMPHLHERGALRPWVYYCLIGLLSVTGLRLGEACGLELRDVNFKFRVADRAPSQVRPNPPCPVAQLDPRCPRRIHRPTPAPLGRATGIAAPVCFQLGKQARWRGCPPHLLRVVAPGRPSRRDRQSRATSA